MAVERGSDGFPLCPRCGASLHRQRRHFVHRVLSLVYPVRAYACTAECGFTGLLPSRTQVRQRKRQLRLLVVFIVLAFAAGLTLWKYRADLTWNTQRPFPGDGVEESGAAP